MITNLSQNSDKQKCIQNTLVSINVLFFFLVVFLTLRQALISNGVAANTAI